MDQARRTMNMIADNLELSSKMIYVPKMCDSSMCTEKAVAVDSYKGQLFNLCRAHVRNIRRQKKADNNV